MLRRTMPACLLMALVVGGCAEDSPPPMPKTGGALEALGKKAAEGNKTVKAAAEETGDLIKTGAADAKKALGDAAAKTIGEAEDQVSKKAGDLIDTAKKAGDTAATDATDAKAADAVEASKKAAADAAKKAGEDPAKKVIDAIQPDKDLKFGK